MTYYQTVVIFHLILSFFANRVDTILNSAAFKERIEASRKTSDYISKGVFVFELFRVHSFVIRIRSEANKVFLEIAGFKDLEAGDALVFELSSRGKNYVTKTVKNKIITGLWQRIKDVEFDQYVTALSKTIDGQINRNIDDLKLSWFDRLFSRTKSINVTDQCWLKGRITTKGSIRNPSKITMIFEFNNKAGAFFDTEDVVVSTEIELDSSSLSNYTFTPTLKDEIISKLFK